VSTIELAVHAPSPYKQSVGGWGWPEERQSWSWPGHEGKYITVNAYAKGGAKHTSTSECTNVTLSLDDKVIRVRVRVRITTSRSVSTIRLLLLDTLAHQHNTNTLNTPISDTLILTL